MSLSQYYIWEAQNRINNNRNDFPEVEIAPVTPARLVAYIELFHRQSPSSEAAQSLVLRDVEIAELNKPGSYNFDWNGFEFDD